VAEFVQQWLKQRPPATRSADTQRLRDHVLPVLGSRRLRELRAQDVAQVVRQTLAKKGMTVKSARNAHAVFDALLGDALKQKLIAEDPRALPEDIWPAEEAAEAPRYSLAEVAALTSDERLEPEQRIYNTLAFYSRLEPAELCQLRFGDWRERVAAPLAPELSSALEQWQRAGFEATFGRAPTDADWLVPRRSDITQPHSEGSAFKAFRRACVALKIKTRSPRAVQNTFGAP
jgi:integrase